MAPWSHAEAAARARPAQRRGLLRATGVRPLSAADAHVLAGQLKALAGPARLRLLSLMMANEDFESCTCDLTEALELSQPTVSHHLKKLSDAGLVFAHRKQGPWTYYRVVPGALASLADAIATTGPAATTVDSR